MADENHAPEIVLALSPRAVQPHTLAGTRGAVIDLSGGGGTPCANGHAQHSPAPIGLAHPPAQPPPQHGARLGKMDASSGRSPPSVPALADGELSIDLSATRTPRPLSVRVDDTQRQPPANVSGHREGPSQSPSPPRERRHVRSCRDALATVRSLGLLITALLLTTAWFVHGAVGDILVTMRPTDGPDSATWPAAAPHAAAPPSPPDAPGGPVVAWKLQPASCTFNDFVSLVSCRHGYNADCCQSYRQFLEHQCVCDFGAWPKKFIPHPEEASAGGWMSNLMKCGYPILAISNFSSCIDQLSECAEPRDGDVRLSNYPRGSLEVFAAERWGAVCESGFAERAADTVCAQLGYEYVQDAYAFAPTSEHVALSEVRCQGGESSLAACALARARVEPGTGDGACAAGDRLMGIACGPAMRAGPEVCYMSEHGQRQCWNVGGYGTEATMVCGTAGRRGRPAHVSPTT
ncbi:hypothetical protein KFE25_003648 [Diacronema lutheri]|uniref:SRCR domain-containing protein n=2 Tax=Diacronema lutheri TaxID=2081491 RepID=A0A8J6C5H3_DIALT|nr:hypothetical protein KFE25_003648 [Diacronema lutheri]